MKKRWSKISPGDVVELGGRAWTVEKTKPKKRSLVVVVRSGSHRAESKVDPEAKVKIAPKPAPAGTQRAGLGSGQRKSKPAPSKPPKPATGDPWETQQDRIERRLGEILSARLVGESTNGERSWYVPPVDVSTVAAHLALFHKGLHLDDADEGRMVELHAREHLGRDWAGNPLHTHSDVRPTTRGKKKS